jgi:hypothetical protein
MNEFPPFPKYPIGAISNMYEKFAEIFESKGLSPVSTTGEQAHIVATVSSLVSLTLLAINYRQCHCYRQLIILGVIVTGNKLISGVMESIKIRDKASSMVTMTRAIIHSR